MGLNKRYRLGELIEQSVEVNSHGEYTEQDVRGIANTKEFMPTKADIKGRNLSKFQIVKPGEFAFNRRTTRMGEKIAIGFNDSDRTIIVTEDYVVFRVIHKELLLPEFLFMFLDRGEFDRYARWDSWGSATEFFNWENMCHVPIKLPSMEAQKKAVAIYNGLKDNLAAYENGLEDLKLTCDGFIEELGEKYSGTKLDKYLQYSDKRNDEDLDLSHVRGLSIDKKLIPTKANMQDVGLQKYKILEPGQFAYVPVTSRNGNKITIALNDADEKYLVSSAYEVFGVNADEVYPAYLMMYFSRPEFDRYARFHSWGSARESFDWTELCNVEIPLPDIKVQSSIADIYTCYIERKRIADELREKLKNICPLLLRGAIMTTD